MAKKDKDALTEISTEKETKKAKAENLTKIRKTAKKMRKNPAVLENGSVTSDVNLKWSHGLQNKLS